MIRPLVLVVSVACGGDPATPPDVMLGVRCDPSAPFGAPVPVDGVNSAADDAAPRLSPDELTMYFARRTNNQWDLYSATRPARDAAFGTPEVLGTANSVNNDLWPTVSADGMLLLFDSDRGTGISHIFVARRTSTTERFTAPSQAPALMDGELHPLLANNRALYFSSPVRGGAGLSDLWRVEIDSTGATGTPEAVPGDLNTVDNELVPVVSPDELTIFFERQVGRESDIFTASRATTADPWGTATAIPGLSTPGISEVPGWVSPDGCALYLHSNSKAAEGSEIYVAVRP